MQSLKQINGPGGGPGGEGGGAGGGDGGEGGEAGGAGGNGGELGGGGEAGGGLTVGSDLKVNCALKLVNFSTLGISSRVDGSTVLICAVSHSTICRVRIDGTSAVQIIRKCKLTSKSVLPSGYRFTSPSHFGTMSCGAASGNGIQVLFVNTSRFA